MSRKNRAGKSRTARPSRHLFDCWPEIAERVRSARRLALFLDFDGTLAPFRLRPEQVKLSERTRRALRRLVCEAGVKVFVVSGRRRADVENRVGVPGVHCFGLHGWEGPTARPPSPAARLLRQARQQLRKSLAGLRGVWIEEKGPTFAVHVREAAASAARQAGAIVQQVMECFEPDLRLLPGNQVWEVTPQELEGKGAKVRALLRQMPAATLPIFLGDDTTDESAFAVLHHGITVCVGARQPTLARFGLLGPREVQRFLQKLGGELQQD